MIVKKDEAIKAMEEILERTRNEPIIIKDSHYNVNILPDCETYEFSISFIKPRRADGMLTISIDADISNFERKINSILCKLREVEALASKINGN